MLDPCALLVSPLLLPIMDFEHDDQSEMDTEMIPIIPSLLFADESNYPSSANAHTMQNGLKSVSNSRLSSEQQAALEDPKWKGYPWITSANGWFQTNRKIKGRG